jgi:hypothetical protein
MPLASDRTDDNAASFGRARRRSSIERKHSDMTARGRTRPRSRRNAQQRLRRRECPAARRESVRRDRRRRRCGRDLRASSAGGATTGQSREAAVRHGEHKRTPRRIGGRLQPERLGHDLAEQLEVAVSLWVRPVVDHDLAADEGVAVEGVLEHDVAGIARKDAAVWGLE